MEPSIAISAADAADVSVDMVIFGTYIMNPGETIQISVEMSASATLNVKSEYFKLHLMAGPGTCHLSHP